MTSNFEKGLEVRKRLFGEERTRQSFAATDDLTQKFQRLVTASCFGEVWADETVKWRERSLISMSIVAALRSFTEFELHVRLGLKNGCSREEIIQVVQHLTVYSGVPTGYEAFRVVQKVFQELEALGQS